MARARAGQGAEDRPAQADLHRRAGPGLRARARALELTSRIRRSDSADGAEIRALTAAAFAGADQHAPPVDDSGQPGEAALVGWLLADPAAIPELSLVALDAGGVMVGHVVCSRGSVDDAPALGLGPLSVLPGHQRSGVGTALVRAVLEAADERGESVVCLLGDPAYYSRFGFRPAAELGIAAPDPAWGGFFQALALGDGPVPTGTFRYAEPFDRLAEVS